MERKRFSDEPIAFGLRSVESGTDVEDIRRKLGISEPTFRHT